MAYYSGGTVHVAPAHHLQPQYNYPQAAPQQQSWPPVYYNAHSYQTPTLPHQGSNSPHIQPDPLPPHSNPQDLSPTQSRAFAGPMPCTPIRLGKEDVFERNTNMLILSISRKSVHMPSFLSSKPLLTVTRCNTNTLLGTILFHHMSTSDIDLSINGRETRLSPSRLHKRWAFQPTSVTDTKNRPSEWYWKRDKLLSRSVILFDSKKRGRTIARIDGSILTFEQAGLGQETLDEIVMTAVTLAEHARRHGKNADVGDLGGNIADLVETRHADGSSGTTHHGGGSHHGGHHGSGHGGFFGIGGDGGGGGGGGGMAVDAEEEVETVAVEEEEEGVAEC
ncbi:hypothetical protein Q7P36_004784 [Cladosporium allicinum]